MRWTKQAQAMNMPDLLKNARKQYIDESRELLENLLVAGKPTVSIDDLWELHAPPRYLSTAHTMRLIFMDKRFKRIDTRQSRRPAAQKRYIGIYTLAYTGKLGES